MPYKDPKTEKTYASKAWMDKNINPATGKSFAEEKRKAQVAGQAKVVAPIVKPSPTASTPSTKWQAEIAKGLDPAWVKANVNPKTGKTYAEEKREAQVAIKEPLIEPLDEPEPFIRPPEPLIDPGKVPEMVADSGALREKEAFGEKGEEEERQKNIKEIEDLTNQQQLKNLRVEAGLDPDTGEKLDKPAIPTFETDFDALRDEHGMSALESQINNLNSSIADAEASLRLGMYDEEGKLKPMELIGAAQEKLARQGREAVDALLRRKAVLVDEYNTKLNVVNSLMQFSQLDYNAAVADYNTQFNQNIQLLNILEGREDDADREKNVEIDNARANLTLITNVAKESGQTWDELDSDMQSQITALEMKSGLPSGITQAFMNIKPDAEVMATTTSFDADGNQQVSFIYKGADGKPSTVEVVQTGGQKAPKEPTSAEKETAEINEIEQELLASKGEDGFISPEIFQSKRTKATIGPDEFNKRFKHLLSPQERTRLGIDKEGDSTPQQTLDALRATLSQFQEAGFSREEAEDQWKVDNKLDTIPDTIKKIFVEVWGKVGVGEKLKFWE